VAWRCGLPHPDFLMDRLTAGQWLDLVRYDRQFHLGPDREDEHWGRLLAMTYNANFLKDGELGLRPCDLSPHLVDPLDEPADDTRSDEELRAEMMQAVGIGSRFIVPEGP
jgi:hypothetical protein